MDGISLLAENFGGRSFSAGSKGALGEVGVMMPDDSENVDLRGIVSITIGIMRSRSNPIPLGSTLNYRIYMYYFYKYLG